MTDHVIHRDFFSFQIENLTRNILIFLTFFCSKHTLLVHVRTASVRRFLFVPTMYVLDNK